MGSNLTMAKYSYHISKDLTSTGQFFDFWPLPGFDQYCTSKHTAINQFQKYIKKDPKTSYKLVRCDAVYSGTKSNMTVLKEYTGE